MNGIGIRLRMTLAVAAIATAGIAGVGISTTRTVQSSAQASLQALNDSTVSSVELMVPVELDTTNLNRQDQLSLPPPVLLPFDQTPGQIIEAPADGAAIIVSGNTSGGAIVVSGDAPLAPFSTAVSGPDGIAYLTTFTPDGGLDHAVNALRRAFWIGGPLVVLILTAAAWLVTGRALRPVARIVERTRQITTDALHQRVPVPAGNDDVAELALTMNDMLTRLEAGAIQQRQFVSDASHELRSPLTALLGEIEISIAHPNQAEWPTAAARALRQGERLESLVANLLEASTLTEHKRNVPTTVDLAALAQDEVSSLGITDGVSIEVQSDQACQVTGDRAALASAVRNLVTNAVRHATSSVIVSVSHDSSDVVVRVDDDGPGIPADSTDLVFERFTRLDESRSHTAGGAGLGLAIVRSIAQRHQGQCVVDASALGGARFTLTIPRQPEPAFST